MSESVGGSCLFMMSRIWCNLL